MNAAGPFGRVVVLKRLGPVAIVLVALAAAPSWVGDYGTQILFRVAVGLVLAQAWNLLAGQAGLVSLGTSAAVGVGGYVYMYLANTLHASVWLGLGAAAAAGAAVAAAAAPGLLRLRGLYFTVGTLALAECLRLLMINVERFGGATGFFLDGEAPDPAALVRMTVVLLAVASTAAEVSRYGRPSVLLRAVRDDEDVAEQFGVRPFRVKLTAFAVASALMAAAGGLQALKLGAIEPYGMFGLRWSVDTLSMVVIGGLGHPAGPWIGAAFVVLSGELLADFPEAHLALTGIVLILIMRYVPNGLAGLWVSWTDRAPVTGVTR